LNRRHHGWLPISNVMKTIHFILIAVSAVVAASSAAASDVEPQVWADYHGHFYLSPDWEFYGDTGARYQWDDPKWATIYIRPSIRLHSLYRKPSELRGGVGVFYSFNEDASNTLEIRPWLGLLIKRPRIGPLTISNYIRLEERLVDALDERSWSHSTRLRYRVGTKIPLRPATRKSYWFIPMSFEWFWDVGQGVDDVFSDRLRIDAGVGKIIDYTWTAEFHVIFQEHRDAPDEAFSGQKVIFRFQLKRLWSAHDYMSQQ
jgi:hypothetical protein